MTRRDFGMLCIFTTQKALRENAQPYRFWGPLDFLSRSERLDTEDTVVTALREFINRRKDESEQLHLSDLVTEKVKIRNKQYNQDEILAAIDEAVPSD